MKPISILLLIISISCFSQKEKKKVLFFDENENPIEAINYYEKCNSFLFHCNKYEKNNTIYNSIIEKYKFGEISKKEASQIYKLLSKSTNTKLDNKTILINYREMLYDFKSRSKLPKNSSFDKHYTYKITKKGLIKSKVNMDNRQKKCIKTFNKIDVKPLYLYNYGFGDFYKPKNFNWYKIHPIVKNLFFQKKSPSILILKPNGHYFRYINISEKKLKALFTKDWETFIKDYQIAKTNLLKKENGFFKGIFDRKITTKFYIDKSNGNNIGKNIKPNVKLPKGTIIVKNKAEIIKHLNKQSNCYMYPAF